jgi:hypothetical protein
MKKLKILILAISLILYCTGCTAKSAGSLYIDAFYQGKGEWSFSRFPLLKPYQMINAHDDAGWFLEKEYEENGYTYHDSLIFNVDNIAIVENLIFIHSTSETAAEDNNYNNESTYFWYVITPDQGVVEQFEEQTEFVSFILDKGLQSIHWNSPDSLYEEFWQTDCLAWIPNC